MISSTFDQWQTKKTLAQLLRETTAKFGDREAWVFGDARITFRQLSAFVDRLAGGFLRLGIQKGDKVSIWMPNRLEWVYTYFAVAKIGAVLVPVNTRFKANEAAYVVGQSDSSTLIIADRFLNTDYTAMVSDLCPELAHAEPGRLHAARLPNLRRVICLSDHNHDGMYPFADIVALGNDFSSDKLRRIESAVSPEDLLLMPYTSGTTGFPKGVMHSHKAIRNMEGMVERFGMSEQDCVVFFPPLFHVFGVFATIIGFTIAGGKVVLMDAFDAGESLRLMEKERATITFGVDTTYFDQLRHPDFDHRDLKSLRTGNFPGGPPNVAALEREVISRFCKVRSVYGMSETTSLTSISLETDSVDRICTSSGYPLPGFELKIVDPETGRTLPSGVPGEICVRGHAVMHGYYKKPEETAKAIDTEGWFHTGDLSSIDEQGYVRFLGRLKDIVRVGGENADPVELETLLLQHPAIAIVHVAGVPDKRLGEVAAAFIQFNSGKTATEQQLIDFCRGKIASFKVPRYVLVMDEYPMTASGKVQKFRLREIAMQRLGIEAN